VVVVSYTQLQDCRNSEKDKQDRAGLFLRIIVDEAEEIRRCDQTKQGAILKSFKARFKAFLTGSPAVDSILDFDGYLAFLEFPFWSNKEDLNLQSSEPSQLRYAK
jgi:SNF2 family DNA or RNA helicase